VKNFISFFSIILFWGNIAIADQFDFPLNFDLIGALLEQNDIDRLEW